MSNIQFIEGGVIKDSGTRKQFETGAVRDAQEGKGRCDLLPLDIIGEQYNCPALLAISDYVYQGNPKALWYAIDLFIRQNKTEHPQTEIDTVLKAILSTSKHYEAGALKYSERNWEKGIPLHCYINSGVRHLLKVLDGWEDEPHGDAFVWNMLGAIWTQKHFPELVDLPFAWTEVKPRCK